jgi:putative nucleotidyltransferase with HDIG domain
MTPRTLSVRLDRLFFGSVISVGSAISLNSGIRLYGSDVATGWLIFAALTLLTGSFTVKIPKLSVRLSVSDAFVFASILLFGTDVATVIVAVDSLVATCWMRRENRSLFRSTFNLSTASLSIWTAATIFFWLSEITPGPQTFDLTHLLWPLFILAASYFLLNSWIIAIALAFERNANPLQLWWTHFPWFSLNYFGGVSAAAILVSSTRHVDWGALSIIIPLLIISYLTYRTAFARIQDAQRHLEQLNDLYLSTIEALAMAVDAKDQITHGHIRRVQVFAVELAKRLGVKDRYHLTAIETAALLHDMGKLAIPEYILNKPGKLSAVEFEKMKRHADLGADLLSSIKFPYPVVPIVRHHHESWDGTGYPSGVGGTDIPLGARILSVVDCYDALTSDRPYRPRLSPNEAFDILKRRRGTMYDPLVVDTFIGVFSDISPKALQAGQEARTIIPGDASDDDSQSVVSLHHIRSTVLESTLLSELELQLGVVTHDLAAMEAISRHLQQLLPSTIFALYTCDPHSDDLVCTAASGDPQGLLAGFRIRVGERVVGWCAANLRTSLNSHAYLDLGPLTEEFTPHLQSTLSTPLAVDGRILAVLSAYSNRHDAFDGSHQYLIERVASLVTSYLSKRSCVPKGGIPVVVPFLQRHTRTDSVQPR